MSPRPDAPGVAHGARRPGGGPRRVVFALDTFGLGGTELNAIRTAERLDAAQVEVQFVCLGAHGPLLDRVHAGGFRVTEFPIGRLVGVRALREGLRLLAFLRRERTDVFHAHDIYTNIWGVPWARLAGVPLVIASRRWWHETNRPVHVRLNTWAFRLAHRVLANSPAVAALVAREGVPAARVLMVPNFVEDAAFESPGDAFVSARREELGLARDDEVVGIVANFHAIKDVGTIIRAVAHLAPHRPRVKLVLVGDGAERAPLAALAQDLGIAPRVIFAGQRPSQPSFHWLFDVSVLCSRGEGFPNAIVEAMAAARPVVATAVGGVPDAVINGETGVLVAVGDHVALAREIGALLDDPERRRAMGAAGVQRARAQFAERAVLHRLEATYREAVADPA